MLDYTLQDVLKQRQADLNEFIMQKLEGYKLITGNYDIYGILSNKYPSLDIQYSEYINDKENVLLINLKDFKKKLLQPIELIIDEGEVYADPQKMTYKCSVNVGIKADGIFI